MKLFSFDNFIRNMIKEEITIYDLFPQAVSEIDKHISKYTEIKIGKTSIIENRFDTYYKKQGYQELIPIIKCPNKKIMDKLEKDLIEHFEGSINNTQMGGGNKSYTQNYWIYIVVK